MTGDNDYRQFARDALDRMRYKPLTWKEVIEIARRQQAGSSTEEDNQRARRWLEVVLKTQGISREQYERWGDHPPIRDDWRDDD